MSSINLGRLVCTRLVNKGLQEVRQAAHAVYLPDALQESLHSLFQGEPVSRLLSWSRITHRKCYSLIDQESNFLCS